MHDACQLYLLPIGGTATAALAGLLHEAGERVCGVDSALYPPTSELLAELGVPVRLGYDPDGIPPGIVQVIIGNAVGRANPEVAAVLARGIPYTSQAAYFGERFCRSARSVVIAGTHGKTTTTALAAHLFVESGLDPTVLVGGVPRGGRPWRLGRGGWTVVEGDEYNTAFFDRGPKFLHYAPHLFVVGNVEYDHADLYPDLGAIVAAFRAGVARVGGTGWVVANAGDPGAREAARGCRRVMWYGLADGADLRCLTWAVTGGRLQATVQWGGETLELETPLVGRHNVDNLLAATACALLAGAPPAAVAAAAATFPGVRRRLELVGEAASVAVLDDFAHHPTAVRLTLEGARQRFPGRRLVVAFEPRSLSAARAEFGPAYEEALARADAVLLAPVFHRARLAPEAVLDRQAVAAALGRRGVSVALVEDGADPLPALRALVRAGDVVVCMSSGDFGNLPRRLLALLREGA